MANKIRTVMTYPLNGAVNFTITFEYLARKFIQVTLIGKDRKELVLNQDYRFTSKNQITTTRAWTAADGYQMIEVRRFTSATDRLVDFADGSILRAYDLNISQIQTLHVAEEARDLTADTIGVNNDGHLDARGRKIVNLAYATSDFDAVPFKQVREREQSAWNAVTKATGEADRATREANRSRDEANRAKGEADRATQRANDSNTHANRSKTEADRSFNEANRAKGYADSMTSSVAAAKGEADRAVREANRSRDEANRAAGEVTKAAAQVTLATQQADRSKAEATSSASHANRSKSEADRAKTEADKLGNMNNLANAIERVDGVDVYFKGRVQKRSMVLRNDAKGAGTQAVDQVWNQRRGEGSKETVWEQWIQADSKRNDYYVFTSSDPATWPEGRSNGKGTHNFYGGLHFYHGATFDSLVAMRDNLNVDKKLTVGGSMQVTGTTKITNGSIQMVSNNRRHIQFMTDDTFTDGYIFKDVGAGAFVLNFGSSANMELRYASNGHLTSSAGWNIPPDGNLYIKKYNTYIDAWVNTRLSQHAYNKTETNNLVNGRLTAAQGNAAYFRKRAGWTQMWAGTMGGGQQAQMPQDIRWRTVWVKTNGRLNALSIGDDGLYFISSDGGWLKFQIHGGGRYFKNNEDNRSVPTQILVYND